MSNLGCRDSKLHGQIHKELEKTALLTLANAFSIYGTKAILFSFTVY